MNCSNCEKSVDRTEGLVVSAGEDEGPCVRICDDCTKDVLTLKIVLKREDPSKEFAFEGYLPVASAK